MDVNNYNNINSLYQAGSTGYYGGVNQSVHDNYKRPVFGWGQNLTAVWM